MVLGTAGDCDIVFFFSSRRRHTRYWRDWSSDVCSSDLTHALVEGTYLSRALRTHYMRVYARAMTPIGGDAPPQRRDRERGGEGKRGELGGRRIIKKKNKKDADDL